ncbi:MAG: hypothetical protein ACRC8I_06770, partial [Plesiomonas shigelloides]
VVTNLIPYILSMAAVFIMQRLAKIPASKARFANVIAFIGAIYSFYALYGSGELAMMWGAIATFFGWTLYGFIADRFEIQPAIEMATSNTDSDASAQNSGAVTSA